MQVYQKVASLVVARLNCISANNDVWLDKHETEILRICKEFLPSGSGIDTGTKIDFDRSNHAKLVFTFGYHHMNDGGMYDGWTEHVLTVRPDWRGPDLTISGRNRNDIKDYLYDVFSCDLCREYVRPEIVS